MSLLTPKAVGEQLGLSALSVIRLADSGVLPVVEVRRGERRRVLRFRPESVERFIVSREKRSTRNE